MRTILWLCNNPTPKASVAFGWDKISVGGWLIWPSETLGRSKDYRLCLAFPSKRVINITKVSCEGVDYFAIPNHMKNNWTYEKCYESYFEELLDMTSADIIHIWGTEYPHSLALVNASDKKGLLNRCVISIQGLVSIYAKYYLGNLSDEEKKIKTLKDIIKRDTLKNQQKHFQKRGQFEIECLKKVSHIIGRTDWDEALTLQFNSSAQYHFNNENLRNSFYENRWDSEKCIPFRIFCSQAQYPIKGLDVLLKALPEIIKWYPYTKVVVAGAKIIADSQLKETSYGKILRDSIKKFGLDEHIEFIGMCDEKRMVEEYLKANVFVCPSSIENSPNSVGEAMLLGVPVVASNVGGTNCLLKHNEEGFLYQSDADYMLAYYVKKVFESKRLASDLANAAYEHALKTHNRERNYRILLDIYKNIIILSERR